MSRKAYLSGSSRQARTQFTARLKSCPDTKHQSSDSGKFVPSAGLNARKLAGSAWQIDGFSVRCMSIGVGPGFFASQHLVWIAESFRSHEKFERSHPGFVVGGTIVRGAAIARGLEFIGEHGRP